MAFVQASPSSIAVTVDSTIRIFSKTCESFFEYKHNYQKEATTEETVDYILFSPKGSYFLTLFSDKTLAVWEIVGNGASWNQVLNVTMSRRSTSAAFDDSENEVYVTDKSGDLYKIFVKRTNADGKDCSTSTIDKSILGHVSILLDVTVTEKFIITADRDEKIRISLKEKPHVINCFCLGHTEFVCKVLPFENDYLLSTSGDGNICVWNLNNGTQLCKCSVSNICNEKSQDQAQGKTKLSVPCLLTYEHHQSLCAVANVGENDNSINVYNLSISNPYLKACYEIILGTNQQVVDILFDRCASCTSILIVLIQENNRLRLLTYSCTFSSYNTIQNETVDHINKYLEAPSVSDARHVSYLQLFKTTIPGHTYDAFYKKKSNHFKKEKSSKKMKLQS